MASFATPSMNSRCSVSYRHRLYFYYCDLSRSMPAPFVRLETMFLFGSLSLEMGLLVCVSWPCRGTVEQRPSADALVSVPSGCTGTMCDG